MTASRRLELLTGPEAESILRTALESAGGRLLTWSTRQVDHRPTTVTTVAYRARVAWADQAREETLVARTGDLPVVDAPGVVELVDGSERVQVWRVPLDPALPALAAACDQRSLVTLLESYGIRAPAVEATVVSYRPARRAVLAVTAGTAALMIKVVRPDRIADLQARHRLLHRAGVPVPTSLGWSPGGALVMPRLPGRSIRDRLAAGDLALPSGADLVRVLDRLPVEITELPRRRPWADHAGHYAAIVGGVLPSEASRSSALAESILAVTGASSGSEPTHGDLYETQLLADGSVITGLLDVDTAGPGRRVDDLACALGHLSVLAQCWPHRARQVRALGAGWLTEFDRISDPYELRVRTAGVVLSLATGPHRVQERAWQQATTRRLDLVEEWLASARMLQAGRARRTSMTELSPPSRAGLIAPSDAGTGRRHRVPQDQGA